MRCVLERFLAAAPSTYLFFVIENSWASFGEQLFSMATSLKRFMK